jgi:heptosyltransferase-2
LILRLVATVIGPKLRRAASFPGFQDRDLVSGYPTAKIKGLMTARNFQIRKILFVRMSARGDIILATPLIRAVRAAFPQAELDWLLKERYKELLLHHPLLHRVIGFEPGRGLAGFIRLVRELRREKYDLVVDLQLNPRSVLVRYFGGARMQRRCYKFSLERRLLAYFGLNLLKNAPPVAERYFTALEDFGVKPDGQGPEIYPSSADAEKVRKLLVEAGFWEKPLLGLAPGASRVTKRWPSDFFADAAEKLSRELGAGVVILGGSDEKAVAGQVLSRLSALGVEPVLNFAGELSILQSAALLKHLKLLLANDTALMHLATAVSTPVVAVFGPTSREWGFFPYGPKAAVVEKAGLACRPCSLHGDATCPEKHFRCMLDITPDQVVGAALELLKKQK